MDPRPLVISSHRRPAGIVALLAVLMVTLSGAAPALAAPDAANRYWGYYQLGDDEWIFATTGPDEAVPADGSVEGWRYAVSGMDDPRYPRALVSFEQICGETPAEPDAKRVGVMLDYGRPADGDDEVTPPQPRAACAVVPTDASGTDVLAAVAEHRMDGGMLCGIDGYPATGCFEEVPNPSPEAAAPDEPVEPAIAAGAGGTPTDTTDAAPAEGTEEPAEPTGVGAATWVTVGILVALAVLGALVISVMRRRRHR